jgi:hypothetical protein
VLLALGLAADAAGGASEAVTVDGSLELVVEDHPDGAKLVYSVNAAGDRYVLDVPDDLAIGEPGRRVRVQGMRTGNRVAVSAVVPIASNDATSADSASLLASSGSGSASDTTGVQRTLVLLLNFTAYPDQPLTVAEVRDAVFDAPDSMNAFYREASFDQVSFAGDVVGWLTLPTVPANCDNFVLLQEAIQAADPLVDFTQYDRLILVSPALGPLPGCPIEGGRGTVGKITIATQDGQQTLSVSWIEEFNVFGLAHEMGHNLGLLHANRLECPTETIDASCTHTEYQDPFDVMGTNLYQFNAPHKERLGWLQPANVTLAVGDGTFTVEALETPTAGVQALKVQAAGSGYYYYIEHREPFGFDAALAGHPDVLAGAEVRRAIWCQKGCGSGDTDLLVTPQTDHLSGVVAPGSFFTLDGPHPLFFTPLGVTGGHLDARLRHFEMLPIADADVAVGELLALRVPARDLLEHALAFSAAGGPPGAALWALGDANFDGAVTAADVNLASALASGQSGPEEQRALADVDGDGVITTADVTTLGAVVAGQAPPLNIAVLLWRPTATQCGVYPVTVTVSEGTQSASRTPTVTVGRPRVVFPLPGATVWDTVRIAVETGCPSVDLSIAGGPSQPVPRSGVLWDTTAMVDGAYDLLATAPGGAAQEWSVQVSNQAPLLHLKQGYVKYSGPGRPTKMALSGTLALVGVDPLSFPQGGAPWIVFFGQPKTFSVGGVIRQVVCNAAGSSCQAELDVPASAGKETVRLVAHNGVARFTLKARNAGSIIALPEGDSLAEVGWCFLGVPQGPCIDEHVQFRRANATTYSFRKLH